MAKVAINGMGRIGRAAFKILMDTPELELVAINDIVDKDNIVYLLKHDSVYGRYKKNVSLDEENIYVDDKKVRFLQKKNPEELPWKEMEIDVVFECTGIFRKEEQFSKHIQAGAKYVILSAPAKSEATPTIVHGVNETAEKQVMISCASCTTNCITPVVEILGRQIGIKKAVMTTIHAYTSSQQIVDGPSKKIRRGRAAAVNFVPTSTGAAIATTKALPKYKGKFDGIAIRGPVPVGSVSDLVFVMERDTSVEEVNNLFKNEANGKYKGILGVTEDNPVSSDIIEDPRASVVDLKMTKVVDGNLVKVLAWYDNEWGYTNQMIREALRLTK